MYLLVHYSNKPRCGDYQGYPDVILEPIWRYESFESRPHLVLHHPLLKARRYYKHTRNEKDTLLISSKQYQSITSFYRDLLCEEPVHDQLFHALLDILKLLIRSILPQVAHLHLSRDKLKNRINKLDERLLYIWGEELSSAAPRKVFLHPKSRE